MKLHVYLEITHNHSLTKIPQKDAALVKPAAPCDILKTTLCMAQLSFLALKLNMFSKPDACFGVYIKHSGRTGLA